MLGEERWFGVSSSEVQPATSEPSAPALASHRALSDVHGAEVFDELLPEFPTKLPPRDTIAQRLERERGSLSNVLKAATILEKSLQYTGVSQREQQHRSQTRRWFPSRHTPDHGAGGDVADMGDWAEGSVVIPKGICGV